jgi:glucan biosynthesis protein C
MSMKTESKKPRLLFLDNIKVLFTVLVIFQHARVTYNGDGWWYYVEPYKEDLISAIFFLTFTSIGGLLQASLLGLFFLMGGYFTPKSYDRKGAPAFWKERLRRLGIPLLLYSVIINPIMLYSLAAIGIEPWSSNPKMQGSFLDYYLGNFESLESFINFLTNYGPMWFLFVLLILTAIYTMWRQITKSASVQQYIPKEFPIPRYIYLLLFALGLGFVTYLVRITFSIDNRPLGIPVGFLFQYLMMFSVGVIAFRYDWFEKMTRDHVKAWSITMAAAFVLVYAYGFIFLGVDADFSVFMGGSTLAALIWAMAESIVCVAMIFVLIPIFYAKYNHQGLLMHNLSDSAFQMYLVHPPILVLVGLAFASVALIPIVKFAIVFPLTVLLCYLVSHFVIQKIHFNKRSKVNTIQTK